MSLYVDPTTPRHSRRELLDYVKARGFDFSASAFRDWQSKGFIADADQDYRWAKERAGSAPGLWSQNQRELLVELLELRDGARDAGREVTGRANGDVSGLGNIVVWRWLYLDGIVALPQAKKALATWVRPQMGVVAGHLRSLERLYQETGKTVRSLAGPSAKRASITDAAKRLTDVYFTANVDDLAPLTSLMSALRIVIDPATSGRTLGPPHRPVTADDVSWALAADFLAAVAILRNPDALTADDWNVAQGRCSPSMGRLFRRLAAPPQPGRRLHLRRRSPRSWASRSASRTVLYLLGSQRMERPENT
jgi:hypothetical protein